MSNSQHRDHQANRQLSPVSIGEMLTGLIAAFALSLTLCWVSTYLFLMLLQSITDSAALDALRIVLGR